MSLQCRLCPNNCNISEGSSGLCGVRGCKDGKLDLPYYNCISALADDPIEKKPLYHYFPGMRIFSVGFYGCNLSCPFCQNYQISKTFSTENYRLSTGALIQQAVSAGASAIAYTYSEPIVHFEWVTKAAALASTAGLKNVLVTNGYINEPYSQELIADMDAVNIDLKSFSNDFYKNELHGEIEPVKTFIKLASGKIHTEVTTLVIPGKNDTEEEIESASIFLADINRNIPYHLSAYYPSYKYVINPTKPTTLLKLAATASKHLNFVFTGNISGGFTGSYCPVCGNELIKRDNYRTTITGIESGKCSSCKTCVDTFGILI